MEHSETKHSCEHENCCEAETHCHCNANEASDVTDETTDFEVKYHEMLDRYQRCLAEFDNYRKRTVKEMSSRYDDGVRASCEKLLPIVDNFERAINACENTEDNFYQGVAMIARQFDTVLADMGLMPIATEPGEEFDINLHYAVAHIQDENLGQNTVAEILQKGYTHKDKTIRPSMVKVAN